MTNPGRRGFLQGVALAGMGAAAPRGNTELAAIARAMEHRSLKQSSYDRRGGNADSWPIAAGATQEVFRSEGPGAITHIWFTIAAESEGHLKELVLRAYWEGREKPSVEAPIGDFFGLNLGQYKHYESAYLACSPGRSLNCYFPMPFRRSARMTVTNEGAGRVKAFYSNIDYARVDALEADALYFHAQYRQAAPCIAVKGEPLNPTGEKNYVYVETRGRGHLMGVTLGVLLNADGWMGEGDETIFVDDETRPAIHGTGSEDYFLGSWNFGGREGATPFAHHYYGAPLIERPERTGGRSCCYRWHGDNPVTFTRYLRHTMEHGHANDRGDNFYSVAYWYQAEVYTEFPAMAVVGERAPRVRGG
jgi:hypothetical protein